MRARAEDARGLLRIPEAVVWLAEGEVEQGRTPEARDLLADVPLAAALRASSLARLRRALESSRLRDAPRRELELVLRDGRTLEATVQAEDDGAVVVLRDVTRYAAQIAELREQAERDPLTGLLNRRSFLERGRTELGRAADAGQPCAVAVVDLDRFKHLNDVVGPITGDAVLAGLARLLTAGRAGDVVARVGGDEFALVLPETAAAAAVDRLEGALAALRAVVAVAGEPVSFSAGVHVPSAHETLEMALYLADEAVLAAKRDGRARIVTA